MEPLLINGTLHHLHPVLFPVSFQSHLFKGSNAFYCNGNFGQFLVQEIKTERIDIRLCVYRIHKDCKIQTVRSKPTALLRLDIVKDAVVGARVLSVTNGKPGEAYVVGREYIKWEIVLHPPLLHKFRNLFSLLDAINQKKKHSRHVSLFKPPMILPLNGIAVLYQVKHCYLTGEEGYAYLEIKVQELLLIVLAEQNHYSTLKQRLGETEVQKWLVVKNFITDHLELHLTIEQLARRFRTNATSLKSGFRIAFGMGLFEWLVHARMMKAKELLESEKLPVERVAAAVGYQTTSGFIKIYKKQFGYTPGKSTNKKK
jgi:AraC-like DNA-binding protein